MSSNSDKNHSRKRQKTENEANANKGYSKKKFFLEDFSSQLIPGLYNDITLELITPKLPWRNLFVQSILSRDWRQLIQGRLAHEARVRHNTETFVLFISCQFSGTCSSQDVHSLGLYNKRDRSILELPPIPGLPSGIPFYCQCVSLDGKIYVLGGCSTKCDHRPRYFPGSSEVYMLDIAGQRQWQQCTSMQSPRMSFGTGVMNGKIYVFGGMSSGKPVSGSEVYDPTVDVWSPIESMSSLRFMHRVLKLGDELCLHSGYQFDGSVLDRVEDGMIGGLEFRGDGIDSNERREIQRLWDQCKIPQVIDIYNPVKDEWTSIEIVKPAGEDAIFTASGKLFLLKESGIWKYEESTSGFSTLWQGNSFSGCGPVESTVIIPQTIVVVDGELLALVAWSDFATDLYGYALLQSEGFLCNNDNQRNDIKWRAVKKCSFSGLSDGEAGPLPGFCEAFGSSPFLSIIEL